MSGRGRAARALAEHLTDATSTPVTISWDNPSGRPGSGAWRVEWTDGPTAAALRGIAVAHARWVAPLDITTLRWSRQYTPRAWAAALLTRAANNTLPNTASEAVALVEYDLFDTDTNAWTSSTLRAAADLAHRTDGDTRRAAAALIVTAVTKRRDETPPAAEPPTRCAHCAGALPTPAPTGRPSRWCSPACRTRAWRQRHTADSLDSPSGPRAAKPKPNGDEYRYVTPVAGPTCPTHPGCTTVRCHRLLCDRPVHNLNQPGRPRRFCSPACRVAEHRRLHQ
jgi:hypothetical protein